MNKHVFHDRNLRLTPQRVAILDLLDEYKDEHLTANEIHSLMHKINPNIGLATVYRSLAVFEQLALVVKVQLEEGYARYQRIEKHINEGHHHLICKECHKVIDMAEDELKFLEDHVFFHYHFYVFTHQVNLYGLCDECYQKSLTAENA